MSAGRRRHPSSTPDDAADDVCNISPKKQMHFNRYFGDK
jgi:hypothetical protein